MVYGGKFVNIFKTILEKLHMKILKNMISEKC